MSCSALHLPPVRLCDLLAVKAPHTHVVVMLFHPEIKQSEAAAVPLPASGLPPGFKPQLADQEMTGRKIRTRKKPTNQPTSLDWPVWLQSRWKPVRPAILAAEASRLAALPGQTAACWVSCSPPRLQDGPGPHAGLWLAVASLSLATL